MTGISTMSEAQAAKAACCTHLILCPVMNRTGYRFTFLKEFNDLTTPFLKDADKLRFDCFLILYQSSSKINASFHLKTKISPSFMDQP